VKGERDNWTELLKSEIEGAYRTVEKLMDLVDPGSLWRQGFDLCVTSSRELYIADGYNNRVRKVDSSGIITTVAGNGSKGFSGDGGPATEASLDRPCSIAFDLEGNMYIAESGNLWIRKVDKSGIITTIMSTGIRGDSGDGGPATEATLYGWIGIRFDRAGNLYVCQADTFGGSVSNCRIRRIDPSGVVTAFAGTGKSGNGGDGGPALKATFKLVSDIVFDKQGNTYIADYYGNRVRKIDQSGIITTVVGGGSSSSDGDQATKTFFRPISGICFDTEGNMIIGETNRIRQVDTAGIVSTIAGTRQQGYSGDGGSAIAATFGREYAAPFISSDGSIYVVDWGNFVVRRLFKQ
jgi:hypothetical protein